MGIDTKTKDLVLEAVLAAGKAIMEVYSGPIDVEMKDDRSPLTEADKRGHRCIEECLKTTGLPVLSEEGRAIPYWEREKWNAFWMVDPLDGTKEFIKRNGEFTVNVALIEDGIAIFGVVYAPVLEKLYWGSAGGEAYLAEGAGYELTPDAIKALAKPIRARKKASPYKVVGSRSHSTPETETFIEKLKSEHGELEFVSMGSSLKLCLVAEGKAQIYPRFAPTMEWDTAAGHAVATGAGCRVYEPVSGTELSYNKADLLNPWFVVEPVND